jgi:hypothetical protein
MTDTTPKDDQGQAEFKAQKDFELAEFKALKDEIKAQTAEKALLERQVIFGMAVLYAVLATLGSYGVEPTVLRFTRVLWFAPPVLLLLCYLRWSSYDSGISQVGKHIQNTYKYQTWEGSKYRTTLWAYSALNILWFLVLGASLLVAVWFQVVVNPSEAPN